MRTKIATRSFHPPAARTTSHPAGFWAGVAGLILLGVGSGCSPEPPPSAVAPPSPGPVDELRAAAESRGREIVSEAGRALSGVLLEAIAQGGYTNAFPLCSMQALPLTTSLAQAHDVELRRVSHRPRNEANRASEQEMVIIRRYAELRGQEGRPEPVVILDDTGAAVFYAPIVITTNLCLQCHGVPDVELRPEVQPLIAQFYPQDEATGFQLGDLRGLWRVGFSRAPEPSALPSP